MELSFAQEILDFDKRASLLSDRMDGEMSVQRPYLVMEAQCDTLDLVLCVTTDNASDSQVLPVSPPLITPEPLLLSEEAEFYIKVIEDPLQGGPGALHNHCASLQSDVSLF